MLRIMRASVPAEQYLTHISDPRESMHGLWRIGAELTVWITRSLLTVSCLTCYRGTRTTCPTETLTSLPMYCTSTVCTAGQLHQSLRSDGHENNLVHDLHLWNLHGCCTMGSCLWCTTRTSAEPRSTQPSTMHRGRRPRMQPT